MPPGPTTTRKPHLCSQCKKAFDASHKLDDHLKATKHVLRCTEPGCTTTRITADGLALHKADDHSAGAQSATPASVVQANGHTASNTTPLFLCTEANCNKPFKTQWARMQHLNMATDGTLITTTKAQQSPEAVSILKQPPAATSNLGQSKASERVKAKNHERRAHTETKAQPHKNVGKQKGLAAPSAKGSGIKPSNPPTQKSLFPWDTRWSAVPTAQREITYSALASAALTAKSDSTDIPRKKKFYTPDVESAPGHDPKILTRQAIVLDCEMVGVGHEGLTSELARVSVIDFFTGVLLVDTIVQPLLDVKDWRTQWSGITAKDMNEAVASGEALKGSTAARAELFKIMDSQTILVGHSLQFDLAALGIRHEATVDSSILAKSAVGRGVKREWALKTLCKELLKITVQDNGKNGHDAVEDALAAREVVLWCLQHKAELKSWGEKKTKEHSNKPQKKRRPVVSRRIYESDSDDDEFLCLSTSELNELCHYPEWYDNWD
jgi:DNA polymerase III epsilon subunit-like protein